MSDDLTGTVTLTALRNVMVRVLDMAPEEISDDAALIGDLEMDSLTFLELGLALESEYGVQVPDADLTACRHVGDVRDLVAHLVAPRAS